MKVMLWYKFLTSHERHQRYLHINIVSVYLYTFYWYLEYNLSEYTSHRCRSFHLSPGSYSEPPVFAEETLQKKKYLLQNQKIISQESIF